MSDARSLQSLRKIAVRESRSLMQYVLGAYPWTTAAGVEAVEQLLGMVEAERDALVALTRYLYRYKIPAPKAGGYPTDFTSMNFADLGYLASVLVQAEEEGITQFSRDLDGVTDAEGRTLAVALLDLKKNHAASLKLLNRPEPAVTP